MSHPLLQGSHRHPRGGHPGAEGVTQVVEADLPYASDLQCLLETLHEGGMREDLAGVGVGENEILVLVVEGALEMSFQLGGDSACQRHRPRAPFRLRGKQVAADVVSPNPDPLRAPIDIAPAQRQQLALAQAGHRCGEEYGEVGMAERFGLRIDRSQERLQLVPIQEVDVGALLDPGAADQLAGILAAPAPALGEGENLRQQLEGV